MARRVAFLTAYQDAPYAQRYADALRRVREAEQRVAPGRDELAETVAVDLFKLMAVKDEYEVARLFTDGGFERQLRGEFSGWGRLEFHLAPPLFAKRDPTTGRLRKQTYGPWMMKAFAASCSGQAAARVVARPVRPFGRTPDGAAASRRIFRRARRDRRPADAGQPRGRLRARGVSRKDPRVWPRQGRGGAARRSRSHGPARSIPSSRPRIAVAAE